MGDIQAKIEQQPIEATVVQQKVEAVIPSAVIINNAVINYIGEDGASAYELAVENGFIGTVGQWLDSLVGSPGVPGLSAYQVALANGFVGTEGEWLEFLQGTDGREIEVRNGGTHIQRRYVGDTTWTNIVALSTLKGDTGANIELQVNATHIQWRVVGAPSWTNLIALSLLQGLQGIPGVPGADGLSAYEVAVNNGFVGTESERLDSMRDYNNLINTPTIPDLVIHADEVTTEFNGTDISILHDPVSSVQVYRNGQLLTEGIDRTIFGRDITFEYTLTDDIITLSYDHI